MKSKLISEQGGKTYGLVESPVHLRRRFDPETGLALINV